MKRVIFNDDGQWTDMVFPRGNYIRVNYRYVKDEHIIFHYKLGPVTGTMKIKRQWMQNPQDYDDILGQAECGLPEMFLPTILNYIESVEQERLNECQLVSDLYDKGEIKQIKDMNWIAYHAIDSDPKVIKRVRSDIKLYTKTTKAAARMKKYLVV